MKKLDKFLMVVQAFILPMLIIILAYVNGMNLDKLLVLDPNMNPIHIFFCILTCVLVCMVPLGWIINIFIIPLIKHYTRKRGDD